MLVFLAVVAFHVVGILGIAMFNGWKFNGIGMSQPQKETPQQQQALVPEKNTIPETAVVPVAKTEPLKNDAKVSSPEQNALEKQILTTRTDADEDEAAIPDPAVSEKPSTGAGGVSTVAGGTSTEKGSKKVSHSPDTVKKTDHSDIKPVKSGKELPAVVASAKEKTDSATKPITSAPPVIASNPSKTVAAPVSGKGYATYTVQKGDTLSKIAREFNTTLDTLSKINSLKDPLSLKAGMTIKVPGK